MSDNSIPTEDIASYVVNMMTGEVVLSAQRLTTGDQYFVYAVKTINSDYVIRMADKSQREKFLHAIYWQEKLLPLGIPLAKFIQSDLNGKCSPFPSLLTNRLLENDLCNDLTEIEKKKLANEIVHIQAKMMSLPEGKGYGVSDSYENIPVDKTWFDFLFNKLKLFRNIIKDAAIFDVSDVERLNRAFSQCLLRVNAFGFG